MTPPIWRDDHGNPRPTRPCPKCGAVTLIHRWSARTLHVHGWQPWHEASWVNWCGHPVEVLLVPDTEAGWFREIPIVGEAR
jgi:hypothetical protein